MIDNSCDHDIITLTKINFNKNKKIFFLEEKPNIISTCFLYKISFKINNL